MKTYQVTVITKLGESIVSQDIELSASADDEMRKFFNKVCNSSRGYVSIDIDEDTEVWVPISSIDNIKMTRVRAVQIMGELNA